MASKNRNCDGYLFDCGIDTEPVLISACLFGIPCRWHGRKPKKREELIERLKKKYVLVPVWPKAGFLNFYSSDFNTTSFN